MNEKSIGLNRLVGRKLAAISALGALTALAAGSGRNCLAQGMKQKTYPTAQKATEALYLAILNNDNVALTSILCAPKRVVCWGDEDLDKPERARFVEKYRQMRRLVREPNGQTELYIGAENWPFPFPLVSANGVWHFDGPAGVRETLFRRIGENESEAIKTCRALAQAGGSTGLTAIGPKLIHGYYFRRLTRKSSASQPSGATVASNTGTSARFVLVAYPAEYRSSGVMTFGVDREGVVFAKDLGPAVGKFAALRPDSTWTVEK